MIECYRCGAKLPSEQFELARWVVIDSWETTTLFVCFPCQRSDEREIQRALGASD